MPRQKKQTKVSKTVKKAVRSIKPKSVIKRTVKATKQLEKSDQGLQATVIGTDAKSVGKITLPAQLFAAKVNKQLLSQAIRVYEANQRSGTASTKTRGEVEGSTRKIYRQKGNGRARHGGIRAPIFVGGGIVFGPRVRDYGLDLPKKMKRTALTSALTTRYQDDSVRVIDGIEKLESKTKFMARTLDAIGLARPILIVISKEQTSIIRIARNISGVSLIKANQLSPYTVLAPKSLVFTKQAISLLKDTFVKER